MDTLQLHQQIVSRYQSYIRSFIDIRDEDILQTVESELAKGKLWPDPLIQFNPSYQKAVSMDDLIAQKVLHPELGKVFSGYHLYSHQEKALRLGSQGKSFVVTSGTGSGKSLTYLGTIFNALFSSHGTGTRALIVYPMNALINSQIEELKKFAENYRKTTGKTFPLSFAAYTGQTDEEERAAILKNPPDILLTNYMMLELLMTRHGEEALRKSLFTSLEFLAFDELHTYRGRQGADVSYLIRRIRAACARKLRAMGTSATMSSQGNEAEQRRAVAAVASKIFGESIPPEQVVSEKLERSLAWSGSLSAAKTLAAAVQAGIDLNAGIERLKSDDTACWVENELAIQEGTEGLKRRPPITLRAAAVKFAKYSGVSKEDAGRQVRYPNRAAEASGSGREVEGKGDRVLVAAATGSIGEMRLK